MLEVSETHLETFEDVIANLERQGSRSKKKIQLYERIRRFWRDHHKKIADLIDFFPPSANGEQQMIDSRHIVCGSILVQHAKSYLERKKKGLVRE